MVSIITPTYNHEAYIEECILSVLAQTYKNWEMLIVDDGSTDQTRSIAQSFAERESRIRVISQENKGPRKLSETYNKALYQSQGEWIAVLEGDDYWFPDKLAVQMQDCDERIVFCYGGYLDKTGAILTEGLRPPFVHTISIPQFIPFLLLHQSNLIAVTALFRKESLLSIGGFHQDGSPAAVDMATLMRLINLPGFVRYEPTYLGVWRHHSGQSTYLLGVGLAKFNAGLVDDYMDRLSDQALKELNINKASIIRARNAEVASACFAAIRQKLLVRSRSDILPLISELFHLGNIKRKVEAVYSLIAYCLHVDLEFPLHMVDKFYPKPTVKNPFNPSCENLSLDPSGDP